MKIIIQFYLVFLTASFLHGQSSKSISLQYINEQIVTGPFAEQGESPPHPGGIFSYEILRRSKKVYRFSQSFHMGYFYHQDVNQLVFLTWKPRYEWKFFKLISIHAMPGLGYGHSFPTQPIYKHNGDVYSRKKTIGQPHFMPSIGLGVGVSFERFALPFEAFVRQEYAVLFPNTRRLPISLNSLLGVGVRYSFNHKTKDDD